MGRATNLAGKRFGRLTVLERDYGKKGSCAAWRCKCDCGKDVVIFATSLKQGSSKSCGCLRNESSAQRCRKHGKYGTRIYNIWQSMRGRCKYDNENTKRWHGRGIKVCDEWQNSFDAFYEWAINNGYDDGLSIDRIDTNGNYTPDNCRWADAKTQANNRQQRKGKLIEIDGEARSVKEWAAVSGVNRNTIMTRLRRGKTGKDLIKRG